MNKEEKEKYIESVYAKADQRREAILKEDEQWNKHATANHKIRGLGHNALNKRFIESHGHHINKTDVVYIPIEIHTSVAHNVRTGKNMKEINRLAYNFIYGIEEEGL